MFGTNKFVAYVFGQVPSVALLGAVAADGRSTEYTASARGHAHTTATSTAAGKPLRVAPGVVSR
ncbi:hypothetical protein [Amycolatopsis pithecellobii]|uniref:hypothetical protein n=1 Tax=Amycolatopsis pithecellobii TaxID=664692 RepID=UPI001AA03FB3|nr:hypothetical protein [Amycolatopsis pithecellobii]